MKFGLTSILSAYDLTQLSQLLFPTTSLILLIHMVGKVGNSSCLRDYACMQSTGHISSNSCRGDNSCRGNSGDIGADSCSSKESCLHNKGSIGNNSVS